MGTITTQVASWNPFSEGYFDNPHPHLHACRAANPVQQGRHGEWILFKYDHVRELLRSPDFETADLPAFFRKKEPVIFKGSTQCPYLARATSHWLPFLNDEIHSKTRQLVESALGHFDFKTILNDCVTRMFADHLKGDRLEATTLGATVPVLLFDALYGEIWGTREGVTHLQRLSHSLALAEDVFVPVSTYRTINDDMQWFFEMVSNDFEHNLSRRPLLTYLMQENEAQHLGFTKDDMASMVGVLLLASVETSQSSMSAIVYELLKDRRLIEHILGADEIMINVLAEELFRYITPQQYTIRIGRKPLHLDNKVIPAGAPIYLCLAAANRDPSVFPDPDNILLDRRNNPHLAFGSGLHSCIGSKLARTEIRLLLKPLANALQQYEIDETHVASWHKTIFIRGLRELMIIKR